MAKVIAFHVFMPSSTPRIDTQQTVHGAQYLVLGAWTAADLTGKAAWDALTAQLKALDKKPDALWDLRQLDQLDHLGAQLLWNHWGRAWPTHLEVEASQRAVLETVAEFSALPAKVIKPDRLEPVRVLAVGCSVCWTTSGR
jgi:phospholipid/cholesterol/gamma-HCH transport system permease protein